VFLKYEEQGMRSEASTIRDPAAAQRFALTALVIVLMWPGFSLTEFDLGVLFDPHNRAIMGKFVETFLPPASSAEFLRLVGKSTLETLAIATAGMALALLIAFPLALIVTRSLSISRIGPGRGVATGGFLRLPARFILTFFRSIPEIVWALLFVRAVGLGPVAGVLAIGVTYGGMLGKVYSEIFESGDTRPVAALLETGSGRVAAFFYGVWPVALSELVSYSVYRWECAVRASVIMGFVGAGGLGQQMELSMRMLDGGEVSTILLVFLLLVVLADTASAFLRKVTA
jgi:phosphonate transport system permease protein